jgi:tetratricopeptide (TPR) repeat protein
MIPGAPGRRTLSWLAVVALIVAAATGTYLVRRRSRLPGPDSPAYQTVVRRFYHGLAALEVGLLDDAASQFEQAATAIPGEPASWANLGVTRLRLGQLDPAADAIRHAVDLAPRNSDLALLQGQGDAFRGRVDDAIADFRHAVDLDPTNLRARYALADQIESSGATDAERQARALFDALGDDAPSNLVVAIERARLAARLGDAASLRTVLTRLRARSDQWPAEAMQQLQAVEEAASASNFSEAATTLVVLRNVLLRTTDYQESLAEVRTPAGLIARPIDRFLRLQPPVDTPAPPDPGFALAPTAPLDGNGASIAFAMPLDDAAQPAIFAVDGSTLRRIGEAKQSWRLGVQPTSSAGVAALDWNRDFRTDLAVAGLGGVRLLVQNAGGGFDDVTASASGGTPIDRDCFGVWAADIEADGDLDLIVGLIGQAPRVLRNNGDGTWQAERPFDAVTDVRDFAWGDIDADGDPDAVMVDANGDLHLFENRQAGVFRPIAPPAGLGRLTAATIGDVDGDGVLDLVTLDQTGAIRRATRRTDGWEVQALATWPQAASAAPGQYRVQLDDLDNNGALDLVISGAGRTGIWLADAAHRLSPLTTVPPAEMVSVADVDGDGRLDAVGVEAGRPVSFEGRGTQQYYWQVLRPHAQTTAGDQRINSFGIGGEIQIRSGLLTQKQLIDGPVVHFGLGTMPSVDVARITWPNGVVQADFDVDANQTIVVDQRLKGSCPWVFADDGTGLRFVTDFLWRSPLGLRINAQDTAGASQTEDWVKIRGDQLAPRAGSYDVRITAELWETHFIDHVELMAVDHPSDLDVFVDERFSTQPPALAVRAMRLPAPVAQAWDQSGRDVTDLIRKRDGRYLESFARGPYQGIAEDHFVDLDLGRTIPRRGPLWLVATGWIYPTDSSINVAIGQGHAVQPHGLSLEALDQSGRWVVVNPDLGFPAGKNKTILIDLASVRRAGVRGARRIRLRTNLEVYWDRIALAEGVEGPVRTARIAPSAAELRYRGFSKTDYARDRPEIPDYRHLANVAPRWRDLVGYYTRFGDVRELLAGVDDRYVIMNAGDELRLLFPALAPPPSGWSRDFVLIGDGWEKDGDFNTTFSKTVLPLPSHAVADYGSLRTPTVLEDDPVYQRHRDDWRTYHTRFVSPRDFVRGLR